jgi:hypothetical protein
MKKSGLDGSVKPVYLLPPVVGSLFVPPAAHHLFWYGMPVWQYLRRAKTTLNTAAGMM